MVLKKHHTTLRIVFGTPCNCKANAPCGLIEHIELHGLIVAHSKRTAAASLIHRLQLGAVRSEQVRQRLHQIVDDLVDFFICILAVVAGRFRDNIEWIFAPIRSFGRIENRGGMIGRQAFLTGKRRAGDHVFPGIVAIKAGRGKCRASAFWNRHSHQGADTERHCFARVKPAFGIFQREKLTVIGSLSASPPYKIGPRCTGQVVRCPCVCICGEKYQQG